MLLHALNRYYERLAADPESGVAPFGYSRQQIGFVVVLELDGTLHAIEDARREDAKGKLKNIQLVVPGNAKPPGIAINPCFLWDNPAYALGYKPDDPKPERTREAIEAFRARHLEAEKEIDDESFSAVCRFLESWEPATATNHSTLVESTTGFGVFQIRNKTEYVHNRPAVRQWWDQQVDQLEAGELGQCLVTGEQAPIARLHEPKIKGVWGGQSAGALLVSFNCEAFESYGKNKKRGGLNAPVAERVAFQYTTALNRLLDPAANRRLSIGDTTVTYWTEKPTPAEAEMAAIFGASSAPEDEAEKNRIEAVLTKIARGQYPGEFGPPDTPFYMLGLSPNAARISVRFWHESTLGGFVETVGRHFADLEIVRGPKDQPHPPPWRLLRETVRDARDIPDLLEGALMRAIITGANYPQMFYAALLRRIQADREIRHARAAAIKAFLSRNYQVELTMALNPDHPDQAYHLGRLFAELEKTQEDALPGINDTIKDRYFGAASATPGSVFPRIIRMNQHHLGKLKRGSRTYHERRIQEIAGRVEGFPSHLSMKQQGLFAIGYYHQRQDIFTKKSASAGEAAEEPAAAAT
ncbi:MAG: type I-C CRISPR-associated protein Cas8c/Csd1 [Planctomycetota bacterium]